MIKAEDPTANRLEIWYKKLPGLDFYLTAPYGTRLGPVSLGDIPTNVEYVGANIVGLVKHDVWTNGDNLIEIDLNQTGDYPIGVGKIPAPSGTWLRTPTATPTTQG